MNMMRNSLLVSAVAVAASIGSAEAGELLQLGLQEQGVNGGAIEYLETAIGVNAGLDGIGVDNSTFGAWGLVNASTNLNGVSGMIVSLGSENSGENYATEKGFGPALKIWVVNTGFMGAETSISAAPNTSPHGLPKGWTITESAFYSPNNNAPTLSGDTSSLISLGTLAYTGQGKGASVSGEFLSESASFGGAGHPWSVVEEYVITPTGRGGVIANGAAFQVQVNDPVTGVPEPSTWATMLAGFGALAFAGYRRREAVTATAS